MPQRLDRYILRQVFAGTLLLTLVFAGIITIVRSLRLIDFVVNHGLPARALLELTTLLLPTFMGLVLPIAVFAAVLFVYARLAGESELVVMRAAGMSQLALARPALLLALLVTAAGYLVNLYLVPASYTAFRELRFFYSNNYGSVLVQEGRFNTPLDNITVYVRERLDDGDLLGIFVHDARDPANPVTLTAERGRLERSEDGARFILFNGNRQEVDKATGRLLLLYFDQNSVELRVFANDPATRWRDPEERTLGELWNPGSSEAALLYAQELRAEAHRRLATPLTALSFTLVALAALLSGEYNRRGNMRRILVAIIGVAGMQGALLGTISLATKNPWVVPLLYAVPTAGALIALRILRRGPSRRLAASPAV